jgi:serpin B
LNIVNSVWGQEGYKFLPEFLDVLAESYGAGVRPLDFIEAPKESRSTINNWVADQTEDRIQDLIPPGVVNAKTRLVLTNAIYFYGAWIFPFNEESTAEGSFYLLDGSSVQVPMMTHDRESHSLGYVDGDGYQALEMLYDGFEVSMIVLLPDPGEFSRFEGSLDAGLVGQVIRDMESSPIALTMPRFEFESEFSLKDALSEMGMPDAFGPADFSGINGSKDLFIDAVVHKAFVLVDELGTEAAAASIVAIATSAPLSPIEVTVDRPFIFLIRDVATDAILFVGRVVDPRT